MSTVDLAAVQRSRPMPTQGGVRCRVRGGLIEWVAGLAAMGIAAASSAASPLAVALPKTPPKALAANHSAAWTGRMIQARTPSYALAWNCQYQLGTHLYWQLSSKPTCPARISVK
jgi:hypothetical protein